MTHATHFVSDYERYKEEVASCRGLFRMMILGRVQKRRESGCRAWAMTVAGSAAIHVMHVIEDGWVLK